MSITSEEIFLHALSHEIRRKILQLLNLEPRSFSQLLNFFDLSNGKLNYHLSQLSGFVNKSSNQTYEITPLGKKAISILFEIRALSETDPPYMKEAFIAQKRQKHPLFRQTMNIWIGITVFLLMISLVASILIILLIPNIHWFIYFIEIVIIAGECILLVWLGQLKKSGKNVLDRVDSYLKGMENSQKS